MVEVVVRTSGREVPHAEGKVADCGDGVGLPVVFHRRGDHYVAGVAVGFTLLFIIEVFSASNFDCAIAKVLIVQIFIDDGF